MSLESVSSGSGCVHVCFEELWVPGLGGCVSKLSVAQVGQPFIIIGGRSWSLTSIGKWGGLSTLAFPRNRGHITGCVSQLDELE